MKVRQNRIEYRIVATHIHSSRDILDDHIVTNWLNRWESEHGEAAQEYQKTRRLVFPEYWYHRDRYLSGNMKKKKNGRGGDTMLTALSEPCKLIINFRWVIFCSFLIFFWTEIKMNNWNRNYVFNRRMGKRTYIFHCNNTSPSRLYCIVWTWIVSNNFEQIFFSLPFVFPVINQQKVLKFVLFIIQIPLIFLIRQWAFNETKSRSPFVSPYEIKSFPCSWYK